MSTVYTSINLTVPLADARARAADPETPSKVKRSINNELKKVRKAAEQVARQTLWETTDPVRAEGVTNALTEAIAEYELTINEAAETALYEFEHTVNELVKTNGCHMCVAGVEADDGLYEANPDDTTIRIMDVLNASNYHINDVDATQSEQMDALVEKLEAEAKLTSHGMVEFPDLAPVEA
ncbi:MAG: hypothetical protein WCF26_28595 [Candidatus Sulfotelmatobacter sp.]